MNSSMWSFRSSMKVASSVFFFLHEAMAEFFGTDGAEPSDWALLESILTLKQKKESKFSYKNFSKKKYQKLSLAAQNVISRMHTVTHFLFFNVLHNCKPSTLM